jgi:hypothetical protein
MEWLILFAFAVFFFIITKYGRKSPVEEYISEMEVATQMRTLEIMEEEING